MEAMIPCIEEMILCSCSSDVVMPQCLICYTANNNECCIDSTIWGSVLEYNII